jgi:hypothetical protein
LAILVLEASSSVTTLEQAIIAVLLIGLLYYALRILTSFRRGLLEQGWKIISWGAIILVAGQLLVALSAYVSLNGFLYQFGVGIDAVGVFFAILGLKSHLSIWEIGKESKAKNSTRTEKSIS